MGEVVQVTHLVWKDVGLAVLIAGLGAFVAALSDGVDIGQAGLIGLGAVAVVIGKAINPADESYGVSRE